MKTWTSRAVLLYFPCLLLIVDLAEPFFQPAAQWEATCLYTILLMRTPKSTAVGEKVKNNYYIVH